ncbi:MAG: CRTAC1 family protein, partial [Acidobacteria bacterium]|nr:CRTAC1 family protein [Acidobacteriota bacterium]
PTPKKHQIETMPAGVAVIDFDNNGFEDLYFVNGGTVPELVKANESYWNRLYRNNGDGTFSDATVRAGVAGAGYGMAAAVADYDNDGWADLFVAGVNRNILYRNKGDGTFADVTHTAGVAGDKPKKMWSISAGWFDYDNDGRLDLLVVNYCKWNPQTEVSCGLPKPGYQRYCHPKHYEGLPNSLYRNNGDGTFTDRSVESGIAAHVGKGMGVAFADYNEDGWIDIFVANDTVPNFLFRNNGDGRFNEIGMRAGVALNEDGVALSSMGADLRDVDNDGWPDLFLTALSNETFPLFINRGGNFWDMTYQSGLGYLTLPSGGWGTGIFDLNNDGWKDLFTAGSHVMDNEELFSSRRSKQPNRVFVNLGGGKFADALTKSMWPSRFHRGAAFGDFNNDGRIDVAVSCLNDQAELLWNRSTSEYHWIQIELRGRRRNRDGIGARMRVTDRTGRVQYNHVTTSVGYASSSTKRVHFGLGTVSHVREIVVRWPSGASQTLNDVAADQRLRIEEP